MLLKGEIFFLSGKEEGFVYWRNKLEMRLADCIKPEPERYSPVVKWRPSKNHVRWKGEVIKSCEAIGVNKQVSKNGVRLMA